MAAPITDPVIFSAKKTNPISQALNGASCYKIVGFGLGDWDYITFTLVAGGGSISTTQGECCSDVKVNIGEYGREPLLCEACCGGRPRPVILTKHNNTVFIDVSTPTTYVLAEYHGDPLAQSPNMLENTTVHVLAYSVEGGMPTNLTASQRGCPNLLPFATAPLPCGLVGYASSLPRDPRATVALKDCQGTPYAYIYPVPYEGATAPVKICTGEILGYAVNNNNNNGDCNRC